MYGAVQGIEGGVGHHGQVKEHRIPPLTTILLFSMSSISADTSSPSLSPRVSRRQDSGCLYLIRIHGFGEVAYIMAQHVGRVFQYLKAEFLSAFPAGHAGHIGLAGCIGSGVKGVTSVSWVDTM